MQRSGDLPKRISDHWHCIDLREVQKRRGGPRTSNCLRLSGARAELDRRASAISIPRCNRVQGHEVPRIQSAQNECVWVGVIAEGVKAVGGQRFQRIARVVRGNVGNTEVVSRAIDIRNRERIRVAEEVCIQLRESRRYRRSGRAEIQLNNCCDGGRAKHHAKGETEEEFFHENGKEILSERTKRHRCTFMHFRPNYSAKPARQHSTFDNRQFSAARVVIDVKKLSIPPFAQLETLISLCPLPLRILHFMGLQ